MVELFGSNPTLPGQPAVDCNKVHPSANPNGGPPGLNFGEIRHIGKLNIQGKKNISDVIKSATGCDLPPSANTFSSAGERHIVWLGPEEYLLLCEPGKEQPLLKTLSRMSKEKHFAIVNVTDSLCVFELSGPKTREVLAKGCSIDLHQERFMPGASAQSLIVQTSVTLLAFPKNKFFLICRTSFAPFIQSWLADAAVEYGYKLLKSSE